MRFLKAILHPTAATSVQELLFQLCCTLSHYSTALQVHISLTGQHSHHPALPDLTTLSNTAALHTGSFAPAEAALLIHIKPAMKETISSYLPPIPIKS